MSSQTPALVIVLAAGAGTRMRSTTPKVCHDILGRSLLGHVLTAVHTVSPQRTAVVVGHAGDEVAAEALRHDPTAAIVVQSPQRGTGHAVGVALDQLIDVQSGTALVVLGDTPLLTGATLQRLVEQHEADGAGATIVTAVVDDPTGYGRIDRANDQVRAIVEHPDADESQRQIREINSGTYAFDIAQLRGHLHALSTDNAKGEEYLTDVIARFVTAGLGVEALVTDAAEIQGINDQWQLAQARANLRERVLREWMSQGVMVIDPVTTWVDVAAQLSPGVVLEPHTYLRGACVLHDGAHVGPNTVLADTHVGRGATVTFTHATDARIGDDAHVGPYTYLRAGTVLGAGSKAGAYVEIKNTVLGDGAKVPHLSYVGDAEIGQGSNIGAATIVANYDGVAKHRTVIGDHVRTGSDTVLVAPVAIGDGAYTAAGSVITDDVPAGSMAVARGKQRNIKGWVRRRRAGSASAHAAEAAEAAETAKTSAAPTQGVHDGDQTADFTAEPDERGSETRA